MALPYYYQLAVDLIGTMLLSALGYYVFRLLSSFRKGMLERGWKLVTYGAIVLALAQIPFIIGSLGSPNVSNIYTIAGNFLRVAGVFLLILGFRNQYQVWRLDDKKDAKKEFSTENVIPR